MSKKEKEKEIEEEIEKEVELKPAYQINPNVKANGFVADYKKIGSSLVVVSKDVFVDNINPKTGQLGKAIGFPSAVYIDGVKRETYDIPADLPMKVIYSLGQAKVILLSDGQAKEYNAFAKKLHAGEIK